MKYRHLPYSVIGLLIMTLSLGGVIFLHNEDAQLPMHDIHSGSTAIYNSDELPGEVKVARVSSKRKRPVNSHMFAQASVADFAAQSNEENVETEVAPEPFQYECGATAREADRYQFEVMTPQIAMPLQPGENFQVEVYIKNVGTTVWCGENTYSEDVANTSAYKMRLGTAEPRGHNSEILNDGANRIRMESPQGMILPNETALFILEGRAPQEVGIYREFYQVVVEQLDWFPETEVSLDVYVGDYTETDVEKINYMLKSGSSHDIDLDAELKIMVDLSEQREYIYKGDVLIHDYLVSSGAYATPTPVGVYEVHNKQVLRIGGASPHYRMPYWVGLKRPGGRFRGYGLHGLPYLGDVTVDDQGNVITKGNFWKEAVDHLGIRVSHGCVRRGDNDAEWLWHLIDPENTHIEVFSDFDRVAFEQTLAQS